MKFTKYFIILGFIAIVFLPVVSHGQTFGTCDPNKVTETLCKPTPSSDLKGFIISLISYVGTVIGLIAIIMLVYAGVRMLLANGDDKKISEAKNTLTYTITGFVISVFAYAGIVAIENFIGVENINYDDHAIGIVNPLKAGTLQGFVEGVLRNAILISGLVAIFMIILNGFKYLTARGDEDQVSTAKKGIIWSLLGLVIIIFAYVIIKAIATLIT